MKKLKIEWLEDISDCDQAGCSGGYATGFIATLDGEVIAEFEPVASCFDSDSCSSGEAYVMILEALGYEVEIEYGDVE